MKINIKTDDIDRFKVRIKANENPNKFTDVVRKSTLSIERNAKNNITKNGNVKTGHLRRSIASKCMMLEGEVNVSNVKYGIVIEKGSKPHTIRPKRGKYLYWEGASHPVKMVKHPGTKPYPFMKPALEDEKPNFIKALKEVTKIE